MVTEHWRLWSRPRTLMVLSEDPLHMVSPCTQRVHTGPSWPTKVPLHLYRCWESIAEGGRGRGKGGREGRRGEGERGGGRGIVSTQLGSSMLP